MFSIENLPEKQKKSCYLGVQIDGPKFRISSNRNNIEATAQRFSLQILPRLGKSLCKYTRSLPFRRTLREKRGLVTLESFKVNKILSMNSRNHTMYILMYRLIYIFPFQLQTLSL